MKILLFYTYNKGFLSGFFQELSIKLSHDKHEVVNFSLKTKSQKFSKDSVSIQIEEQGGYLSNYIKIFKVIRDFKPDIILSNFSYVNPALLFGRLLGIKKNAVWFHSLKNQINPSYSEILVKSRFLKLADQVIGNSLEMKNELHTIYNVPKTKLIAIPFWTPISDTHIEIHSKKNTNNIQGLKIGCPGRLVAHKNQKIVIEALSKIKLTTSYKFQLFLAGSGEEHTNLKVLVNDFNLMDEVVFLGHLSENEMIVFYREMDVVVLPSLHEAFGLVFIEAISLGTPVIVSNKFGALSFIDRTKSYDISQFTFNPMDASELCRALEIYFNERGVSSGYFVQLYHDNFDKDLIYSLIKKTLKIVN